MKQLCDKQRNRLINESYTLILSEMEAVLDLLGSSVLSRRRLESSKLEPTPESVQEMQRDLRLKMSIVNIYINV